MVTFTQLIEKFAAGLKNGERYTEIFEKPSKLELTAFGDKISQTVDNPVMYYLGGILTKESFYVWDRNSANHAQVARELRDMLHDVDVGSDGSFTEQTVPLYVYWIPSQNTFRLVLAAWSVHPKSFPTERVKAMIRQLPYFKIFKVMYSVKGIFPGAKAAY